MPITNDVTIVPSSGGGGGAIVPEGVYIVEITDITHIPGEQNQFSGKPQLKLNFKITEGEYKELELLSWVNLVINPGWDQGSPSNLYKIAAAVMGEDPSMDEEFYPNTLIGGTLQVVVETKKSKAGAEVSRITNYLKKTEAAAKEVEDKPTKKAEDKKVPF